MKAIATTFLVAAALSCGGANAALRGHHARKLGQDATNYQKWWATHLPTCAAASGPEQTTKWASAEESTNADHSAVCPHGQFLSKVTVKQEWWGGSNYGITDLKIQCKTPSGSESAPDRVVTNAAHGSWSSPNRWYVGEWHKHGTTLDLPVGMPVGLNVLNRRWGAHDSGVVGLTTAKVTGNTPSFMTMGTEENQFAAEGGLNYGANCYSHCDFKSGACDTNFCGTGACCRKGWGLGTSECGGTTLGGNGYHMCTRTAAMTATTMTGSNLDKWVKYENSQEAGTYADATTQNSLPLSCLDVGKEYAAVGFDVSTHAGSGITNLRIRCRKLCTSGNTMTTNTGHWVRTLGNSATASLSISQGFESKQSKEKSTKTQSSASLAIKQGFKYSVGAGKGSTDITVKGSYAVTESEKVGSAMVITGETVTKVTCPDDVCNDSTSTAKLYQWVISGVADGAEYTYYSNNIFWAPGSDPTAHPNCPPEACDPAYPYCTVCTVDVCRKGGFAYNTVGCPKQRPTPPTPSPSQPPSVKTN